MVKFYCLFMINDKPWTVRLARLEQFSVHTDVHGTVFTLLLYEPAAMIAMCKMIIVMVELIASTLAQVLL